MKKRNKKLLGILAIGAGAAGAFLMKKPGRAKRPKSHNAPSRVWARPGMPVTFRAELKPGRDRAERTVLVAEVLANGRVRLDGVAGEHTESEFEPLRFS